jgi:hypothetical protein
MVDVEWSHPDTETRTCQRNPGGTVYGISEDGNLYVIDNHRRQREKVFLSKTVAAFYTPVSIDPRGRVYAQNNGELYVVGYVRRPGGRSHRHRGHPPHHRQYQIADRGIIVDPVVPPPNFDYARSRRYRSGPAASIRW